MPRFNYRVYAILPFLSFFAISYISILAPVYAIPIEVSFTASNFLPSAPQDPVVGSFVYEAASLTSPITSLLSVDLAIDGHVYTLAEVDFLGITPTDQRIGALPSGVFGIDNTTNDFALIFDPTTPTFFGFLYATGAPLPAGSSFFSAVNISGSIKEIIAVPEPSMLGFLGFCMIGLALIRQRHQQC